MLPGVKLVIVSSILMTFVQLGTGAEVLWDVDAEWEVAEVTIASSKTNHEVANRIVYTFAQVPNRLQVVM